jgi:hypothetical protein
MAYGATTAVTFEARGVGVEAVVVEASYDEQ